MINRNLAFALDSWDLREVGTKYRGVCINGYSNSEFIAVASWVAFNKLPKKPEIITWIGDIDPLFEERLGITDIFHVQFNEIAIYASDKQLDDLCDLIKTFSVRQYELIVSDINDHELERICHGSNYRLLKNKAIMGQYVVSTDNKDVYIELTLRTNVRYNHV